MPSSCIAYESLSEGKRVVVNSAKSTITLCCLQIDSDRIIQTYARQIPRAVVPEIFSLRDYFEIIRQARLTIGVDTGLTHLSAALECPTIELYCDSPIWKTCGYWSDSIINLGDLGAPPNTALVKKAIDQLTQ